MPNLFASAAMLLWPFVVAALFARLPLARALMLAIVAGYLLLPQDVQFKVSMLPAYNRDFAPAVAALAMCLALDREGLGRDRGWLPEALIGKVMIALFVFSPVLTVLTNGDLIVTGDRTRPGLRAYDFGPVFYGQAITILPFLLARRYLAGPDGADAALRILAAAGAAYAVPMLLEIRLSPFMHGAIYGFRPFLWLQQLRGDGYRPVVFLNHGLWTALFLAMATVAAAALWRASAGRAQMLWAAATAWGAGVLALSSSFGALLLGAALAPVARFAPWRAQAAVAAAIAIVALVYPALRGLDLVPTGRIVAAVERVAESRALSLDFRFRNEDMLLARANERPLLGWGGWSRARVWDPETGEDLSTTDARWIIGFGERGWIGHAAEYGLLTLPALLLLRRRRVEPAAVGLALVLGVNLIDSLVNSTLTPVTWLIAGATLAQVEREARAPTGAMAAARGAGRAPRRGMRAAIGMIGTSQERG